MLHTLPSLLLHSLTLRLLLTRRALISLQGLLLLLMMMMTMLLICLTSMCFSADCRVRLVLVVLGATPGEPIHSTHSVSFNPPSLSFKCFDGFRPHSRLDVVCILLLWKLLVLGTTLLRQLLLLQLLALLPLIFSD